MPGDLGSMEDGGMMMSSRAISQVLKYSRASRADKFILTVITHHFNEVVGQAWPSISMLAEETGYDPRRVKRSLANLRRLGEIRSDENNGGRNRSNRYYITLPVDASNGGIEDTLKDSLNGGTHDTLLHPNGGTGDTANGDTGATRREHLIESKERERAESDKPIPDDSLSTKAKKKQSRAARGVPAELQRSISRIVAKINELSGSQFRDDKPGVLKQLIARLSEGATESDCIAVVEYQWPKWGGTEMADNFNTVTLFRDSNFPR
jgi:uncharacterized phage protein (TIGR02220 family)